MILEVLYFITAPDRTDLYWRPNKCGYTTDLAEAGLYGEREALSIESGRRGDKAIPFMNKKAELIALRDKCKKDLSYLESILELL